MSVEIADVRDFHMAHGTKYCFGLTSASVAAGLRKLADDVEEQKLLPQHVSMTQDAKDDDFLLSTWSLKFIAAPKFEIVPEVNEVKA